MEQQSEQANRVVFYSVAGLLFAFIMLEIVALVLWVPGTWNEQLSAVLAVISLYGLALGFFSGSAALVDFRDMLEELTCPNILRYFRGNFIFLAFIMALVSTGFSQRKAQGYPAILWIVKDLLYMALFPILLVYTVLHLLVVATLSYIPIVMASAIVAGFVHPNKDVEVSVGTKKVMVSSIVKKDQLATKGFLPIGH
jgi:hypothetical protein